MRTAGAANAVSAGVGLKRVPHSLNLTSAPAAKAFPHALRLVVRRLSVEGFILCLYNDETHRGADLHRGGQPRGEKLNMIKHQHKTLARTLSFIGYHSPGEYGLFWDADGTMPWKEFYWALREDPGLRFVRESTLRELHLLGIELPFSLDGGVLRIAPGTALPHYSGASKVPERLYFASRPKNLVSTQEIGLRPGARALIPVCSSRELALRIAKRRDAEPIQIEITARRASESGGVAFLIAGPELYLVESVAREFLIIPKVREDLGQKPAEKRRSPVPKSVQSTPGTFIVQPHHVQSVGVAGENPAKRGGKKENAGWKKESRKERRKRDV